jgi:crotonobetainyl-CoA:carnitine CoA-transferase CaiB-like acyl-CoA transferase
MNGPLAKIRVLEIGHALTAPFAAQFMADFGADVIKVERPDGGDLMRSAGLPFAKDAKGRESESSGFLSLNRNKRSISLDLTFPEAQDIAHKLAMRCDVLIENLKAGDLARYGLDYETIRGGNRGVIYISITGFGQKGLYAQRGGLDSIFQSMSGLMSMTGEPSGRPQKVGFLVADTVSGMYAAMGIMIALYHRQACGGDGQYIDLAMLDAMIASMTTRVQSFLATGDTPQRYGAATGPAPPSEPIECRDGALLVTAARDGDFKKLCAAIGRPEWSTNPSFSTQQGRIENSEALMILIRDIFLARTVKEWYETLVAAGILCSPIYTVSEALADEHVRQRGLVGELDHPILGRFPIIKNPLRMSGTPPSYTRPPPLLGEHTEEILKEELKMTATEIDNLRASGALGPAVG